MYDEKATFFYPVRWIAAAVWTITYIWLILGVIYTLAIACARSTEAWDEFRHSHPDIMPWQLALTLILALAVHVAWMFLWDREYVQVTLALILFASLIAFTVALCKSWHYRKMKDESIEERALKQCIAYHCFLEVSIYIEMQGCIKLASSPLPGRN